jgi:hypothetical protein
MAFTHNSKQCLTPKGAHHGPSRKNISSGKRTKHPQGAIVGKMGPIKGRVKNG